MRWRTTGDFADALAAPPIALPRLELPGIASRAVPEKVGDVAVDQALSEWRVVNERALAIPAESRALVNGHVGQVARFGEAWDHYAHFGGHQGAEEPSPDDVIANAVRVVEWHVGAAEEIELVELAWQNVVVALAKARATRKRLHADVDVARREYLAAVEAVGARYATLARVRSVVAWCDDPDVAATFAVNPAAFTPGERDRNGARLHRVVDGLVALAGPDPMAASAPIATEADGREPALVAS